MTASQAKFPSAWEKRILGWLEEKVGAGAGVMGQRSSSLTWQGKCQHTHSHTNTHLRDKLCYLSKFALGN